MSETQRARESIGGLAISSADWQKIHDLERHAWAKLDEAKVNIWAIKQSVSADLGRLVKAAGDIKGAIIASAVVTGFNLLALLGESAEPDERSWRDREHRGTSDADGE